MPWRFVPLGLLLLLLALGYALGWHEHLSLSALMASRTALHAKIEAHPLLATAGFALVYAVATAAAFPAAALLTIAAGFLFGWLLGGTLVLIAATTGATVLFLAARTAFGDFLRRRVGGRAAQLAKGFEQDAFGYLLVLRLAPIFPFWIVNIVPAFFHVSLRTFIAATTVGILPATYAYAYLGQGLESVLISAAAAGREVEPSDLVTGELTLSLAALATVAALALVAKRSCKASRPDRVEMRERK
ncbi:TVP38/TMEM64 family protein [Chelativorans sp. AA-79]|uniref:TVP38/TMEM64 family protein n=1 Tax=Chelativorans sp. AA-79 TaxID=3028735 RepID=UPI0023F995A1|nr:TVP38/TMEM64 family protein [Chelativorans sp. AA-79]WEX08482.1 TVP38/TMEM64 family protein [Chelativorans sp. AA-79]